MALITRYIREGLLYSATELKEILAFESYEDLYGFLSVMKKYRIVKIKRFDSYQEDAAILDDEDLDYIDLQDNHDGVKYLFRYVGVVYSNERVLKIYPKYISSNAEPRSEMDLIISVLQKYKESKRESIHFFADDSGMKSYNLLSVIFFILDDYINNGLYLKQEDIIEINGDGEIQWQKTIDETIPFISNDTPVYLELYTKEQTVDTQDFFKQLHEIIISSCSKQLEEAELSEVFNMPIIHLSDREIESLGDDEYLIDKIEIELTQQFDDRKCNVLRAMREYIARAGKMQESDEFALLFGTRAFHEVWEEIINVVYSNQSELTFGEIKRKHVSSLDYSILLPNGSTEIINSDMRLDSIIEKPEWYLRKEKGSSHLYKYMPQKTFVPDYLHFSDKRDEFYILDAKYYDPKTYISLDGQMVIEKQPGVEDISKQYMYYLVYGRLLRHNSISIEQVKNYFIMPSEDEDADMGYAKLNVFGSIIPNIFDIRVKKLNAFNLYVHYINDETVDVSTIP